MTRRLLTLLKHDQQGSALIEFALLAPAIFGLMLGVLQVGIGMQSYNAIRSVTADTARYTIVEYQKKDRLTADQISGVAYAEAVNPPYQLNPNNLDIAVTQPATDIIGTIKFTVQVTYTPLGVLDVIGVKPPAMTVSRSIYVSAT